MWRMLFWRVALSVPLIPIVVFAVFVLLDIEPGDPAYSFAGSVPTKAQIAILRRQLGLNQDLLVRYGHWIAGAVHGNLGTSWATQAPVTEMISQSLPVTASLLLIALICTVILALVGGVAAALSRGSWLDRGITAVASVGIAAPSFWLALIAVAVLAVKLQWLPGLGFVPFSQSPTEWLTHLILPALSLSALPAAELALQLRSALLEVLGRPHMLALRAKGLSRVSLIGRHALRNAASPVATVLGNRLSLLIGGTVVVEEVFSLNGVGALAVKASLDRDDPVVLGIVVVSACVVILINLAVDLVQYALNPRVRR